VTLPDPNDIELDSIGSQCDWGGCNDESVAIRWSSEFDGWLPVCRRHRTKDSVPNPQATTEADQ
jgi:hypothetical protein